MQILENEQIRHIISDNYNSTFNKETGVFARWGRTRKDDPQYAPMPEILDIEISSGMCHNSCPFCYKGNCKTGELHNMSFNEFKNIFHKVAKTVIEIKFKNQLKPQISFISDNLHIYNNCFTKQDIIKKQYENFSQDVIDYVKVYNIGLLQQIAFGITSPYDNPDFFKMMRYARNFDVIPNYTCNGSDMTEEIAKKTIGLCGAIALSANDIEDTYNAIDLLYSLGMKQINIHCVAYNGSYDKIKKIISDKVIDKRLIGLNALVLLKYKPKGTNAGKFSCLNQEQYKEIFDYAQEKNVSLGYDSCSCHHYLKSIEDKYNYKELSMYAEPCESTLFSLYINSYCEVFPCSFCENEKRKNNEVNWEKDEGINLLKFNTIEEVWQSKKIKSFRKLLLKNNRKCPMYKLD